VNKLIDKLIEYRLTLRSLQKYEESDVVRDILTDSNIEIEDNKESSSWKFKD
jgi:cysteinyl-tRNA synthetase